MNKKKKGVGKIEFDYFERIWKKKSISPQSINSFNDFDFF